MITSRHKGRELALQELYSFGVKGLSPCDILNDKSYSFFNFLSKSALEEYDSATIAYAVWLVTTVLENFNDINAKISAYSRGRTIDRISPVDLAILRLSFASIMFDKSTHQTIVIDEAVKLSCAYSNEINYKFVNGVLGSFVKENTGSDDNDKNKR